MTRPKDVVAELWTRFESRDWDGAAELLAEDVVVDWPHSRERLRGRANVVGFNRAYPEGWSIRVLRIVEEGDVAVSEVAVDHGGETYFVASFAEVRDGRIVRAVEYWVDPPTEEPDAWRTRWTEPL